jgi:short chain dehydrogenase
VAGGHAIAVRCDVTRSQDVQSALQAAVDRFGRLNFALTTRGLSRHLSLQPIHQTRSEIRSSLSICAVSSCVSSTRSPLMLERGGGAIVNTPSGAGVKGFGNGVAYAAEAKPGITNAANMTKTQTGFGFMAEWRRSSVGQTGSVELPNLRTKCRQRKTCTWSSVWSWYSPWRSCCSITSRRKSSAGYVRDSKRSLSRGVCDRGYAELGRRCGMR